MGRRANSAIFTAFGAIGSVAISGACGSTSSTPANNSIDASLIDGSSNVDATTEAATDASTCAPQFAGVASGHCGTSGTTNNYVLPCGLPSSVAPPASGCILSDCATLCGGAVQACFLTDDSCVDGGASLSTKPLTISCASCES